MLQTFFETFLCFYHKLYFISMKEHSVMSNAMRLVSQFFFHSWESFSYKHSHLRLIRSISREVNKILLVQLFKSRPSKVIKNALERIAQHSQGKVQWLITILCYSCFPSCQHIWQNQKARDHSRSEMCSSLVQHED